eukprot:m.64672 g.64672  ORF g.64672 m.64672 type:complete len:459 (-) comp49730_c0_seq1:112-1488(-)
MAGLALLHRLEGHHTAAITAATFISEFNAVITTSDDKSVLIWLQRSNGQFWPSSHQVLLSEGTCLVFDAPSRRLFVGTAAGTVQEYLVNPDYNSSSFSKSYLGSSSRVEAIHFDSARDLLLIVGKDKTLRIQNTKSDAAPLVHSLSHWLSALAYDSEAQTVFVGDYNGEISLVKIDGNKLTQLATMKGHSDMINSLVWNARTGFLMSASSDKVVIVWDIAGRKGDYFELCGHSDKVTGLYFDEGSRQLLSAARDGAVIVWDLATARVTTPEWAEGNQCQLCKAPFVWNVSQMWANKSVSFNRQHHCRRCGLAVCDTCSAHRSPLPALGFELPVRVCRTCFPQLTDADTQPHAKFFSSFVAPVHMKVVGSPILLVTANADRTVTIFDPKAAWTDTGATAATYAKGSKVATAPSTPTPARGSSAAATPASKARSSTPPMMGGSKPQKSSLVASILDDDDD